MNTLTPRLIIRKPPTTRHRSLLVACFLALGTTFGAVSLAVSQEATPPIDTPEGLTAAVATPGSDAPLPSEPFGYPDEPVKSAAVKTKGGTPGGVIFLKDIPRALTPEVSYPQVILQGEQLQPLTDDQSQDPTSPFSVIPTDRPSAPPKLDQTNAPGGANAPGDRVAQWKALSNTGWIPPDTIHAVGPSHVIEAVNSGFAVYNKTGGTIQAYTTYDSFMNKPSLWSSGAFMFDPRVIYDPWNKRFLMLILGLDETNQKSYFWVAVSKTSNPTQGWCRWRWNSTIGSGSTAQWLDYAGLGADKWGVYVTGNYFRFGGSFQTSLIQTINPAIFTANCAGATNGVKWTTGLTWPSGGSAFSLQPALPHSASSTSNTYFVNTFSGSGNSMLLWKLGGSRTSAAAATLSRSAIPVQQYYAIGNNVKQPGSSVRVDGGDARIMNAVYSQSRVFTTLTTDVNNNGQRSGWLTVRLNTSNNSRDWQHLLYSGNGIYYFYPAITVQGGSSANAHLGVFGSWTDAETSQSATTKYASGLVKIYDNQPAATTGPFLNLVSGIGVYNRVSNGRNRWGDYSGAGYDWSTGNLWGAFEWADTGNKWATSISARKF